MTEEFLHGANVISVLRANAWRMSAAKCDTSPVYLCRRRARHSSRPPATDLPRYGDVVFCRCGDQSKSARTERRIASPTHILLSEISARVRVVSARFRVLRSNLVHAEL